MSGADGHRLATCGNDGKVKLWDAEAARQHAVLEGYTDSAYTVAPSADGQVVASGGYDKTVRMWDVVQQRQTRTMQGHDGGVMRVGFSTNGTLLISGSTDGTAKLWRWDPLGHALQMRRVRAG